MRHIIILQRSSGSPSINATSVDGQGTLFSAVYLRSLLPRWIIKTESYSAGSAVIRSTIDEDYFGCWKSGITAFDSGYSMWRISAGRKELHNNIVQGIALPDSKDLAPPIDDDGIKGARMVTT